MLLQRGGFCLILACVLNLVSREDWSEGQRWVVDVCMCCVDRILAAG